MSEDDLEKLTTELLKKGILVNSYLVRNGKRMVVGRTFDIDFTSHDKVFEDRIASLEKKNKDLESCFTQREQDSTNMIMELNQRIVKLEKSRSEWIDRAVEWQQKCEKLESGETSELPFDPLECANYLINATYERETNSLERGLKGLPEKVNSDRYTIDDLEQIAEHLLVYCKHNKESEG